MTLYIYCPTINLSCITFKVNCFCRKQKKTVTPGLIDAHSHIEHREINAFPAVTMMGDEEILLNMLYNAQESNKKRTLEALASRVIRILIDMYAYSQNILS